MIFASSSDSLWDSSPRRLCSVDLSSSFFTDCYEVKREREKECRLSLVWDGPAASLPGIL